MSSIIEKIIPQEAYNYQSYNGFLYLFTLIKDIQSPTKLFVILKKGKWYLGAHGSDDPKKNCNIDDGYWESCRNEDFRLLFCGTEPVFKLEIFYLCKNWTIAHKEENRMLLEKKEEIINGISFNSPKSLNFINENELDFDINPCNEMIAEVKKRTENKWGITYQPKNKVTRKKYEFVQVKTESDSEKIKEIRDHINDAQGKVKLDENSDINPNLVFEGRGKDGRDLVVNGNVTTAALRPKDCKAQEVPEIRVPYEDNKHIDEVQYRFIALCLNAPEKKVRTVTKVDHGVKFVYDQISKGGKNKDFDTPHFGEVIRKYWNFSKKQARTVMDKVHDKIHQEEQEKINQFFPDYTSEQCDKRCEELQKTYPNHIIFHASVGMTDKLPKRIMSEVYKEKIKAKEEDRKQRTKVMIVMNWKKSITAKEWWESSENGGWIIFKKEWDSLNSDIEIYYDEMEISRDDKEGATDIIMIDEVEKNKPTSLTDTQFEAMTV